MVICLERGADLHMAQLMPLPLTVSCFSKIQIGFTFLVPAHPGSPGQKAVKRVCVCVFATNCRGSNVYTVSQKMEDGILLLVTSPNVVHLSKFYRKQTQQQISSKLVIEKAHHTQHVSLIYLVKYYCQKTG